MFYLGPEKLHLAKFYQNLIRADFQKIKILIFGLMTTTTQF